MKKNYTFKEIKNDATLLYRFMNSVLTKDPLITLTYCRVAIHDENYPNVIELYSEMETGDPESCWVAREELAVDILEQIQAIENTPKSQ